MTGPIVHELTVAVMITGDEGFDIKSHTERDLAQKLVHEARCLQGDTDAVVITEQPFPDAFVAAQHPASRVFRARAICRTPYSCSLPRKADR